MGNGHQVIVAEAVKGMSWLELGHYMLDAQQAGARPCGNAVLYSVDTGFDSINGILGF